MVWVVSFPDGKISTDDLRIHQCGHGLEMDIGKSDLVTQKISVFFFNKIFTQWWCSIFNAIAFIYCFLFMEETNYDRKHVDDADATSTSQTQSESPETEGQIPLDVSEKQGEIKTQLPVTTSSDMEKGETSWPRKTFLQKLSLKDKPRPNRLLDVALAPFKGFLYPPVVYAGLMYGANNLVWSGTQNATAGTVYTTMYGWTTADVSGAYAGGVIGTIIG